MATGPITSFSGEWAPFSNFWMHPVQHRGITYPSNEHGFQALKTKDLKRRRRCAALPTPSLAKIWGRKVKPLRKDWERRKDKYMRMFLKKKFRDPQLRRLLLSTGDRKLVEGNTWGDTYWGQCPLGVGKNRLGILLMELRDELRSARGRKAKKATTSRRS